jgi:transcription-repair coupling factor (superfamily II helicase)
LDLGSGYKVALRDLEIRGAGNLLGKQQSGFVQTVGFDMYCRILDEAVGELQKGLEIGEEDVKQSAERPYTDPKLDTDFDLLIPQKYISSELERMAVYHRLVNLTDLKHIENMHEELQDRFGALPEEVRRFLFAIQLKVVAGKMLAERLILKKDSLKIIFSEKAQDHDFFFKEQIPRLMNQNMTAVKFLNQKNLGVEIRLKGKQQLEQMVFAKKVLQFVLGDE